VRFVRRHFVPIAPNVLRDDLLLGKLGGNAGKFSWFIGGDGLMFARNSAGQWWLGRPS
jgi:hypothetical protein